MKDRTAKWLLRWARWISADTGEWIEAMLAEASQAPEGRERRSWRRGILRVLVRGSISSLASDGGQRPLELTVTALYLVAFSVNVLAHLVREATGSGIREPWTEAWFPLAVCLWLALLPGLFAIGIWLCDDLARKLTAGFLVFDLAVVVLFAHSFGFSAFRTGKFACDGAILAAMFTPRVKQACNWRGAGRRQKLFHL